MWKKELAIEKPHLENLLLPNPGWQILVPWCNFWKYVFSKYMGSCPWKFGFMNPGPYEYTSLTFLSSFWWIGNLGSQMLSLSYLSGRAEMGNGLLRQEGKEEAGERKSQRSQHWVGDSCPTAVGLSEEFWYEDRRAARGQFISGVETEHSPFPLRMHWVGSSRQAGRLHCLCGWTNHTISAQMHIMAS